MPKNIKYKNASTPSFATRKPPLKRGSKSNEEWGRNSLYPYWEIPKNKLLTDRAKSFRKRGVLSEVLFWKAFKDKKKIGFDIDRQVIIGNYIVDFFIPEFGLVFEIDGNSHDDQEEYDTERDNFMQSFNLQVVRIKDADVKKNIGEVYKNVLKIIKNREANLKIIHPTLKGTPQEGNEML